ncbi:MAG TPA: Druantia anti-phage system protein DruA, partial [Gemmatimonadales bacterium]|nr:Druantia anti-phage system protein DruA [Gemmatimonadales bacterium]
MRRQFGARSTRAGLVKLASTGEGRDAIQRVVRRAKAARMGTAIADLTICGAVPPYQEIVGGKLVAALMTSPEVRAEYRRRYGGTASVIASSMAGRRVVRAADLVFIGTTSLYGERPNQYDRIRVDFEGRDGERKSVRYRCLGRTKGLGTVQYGDDTVAELGRLLAQSRRGQRVNSVFGEGVNPRLRKLRDGLGELGLDADELLTHGSPRVVYGVSLVKNLQRYLLGIDRRG